MATYEEIKEYIRKNYGVNVETCHIADIKDRYGLITRIASNRKDVTKRQKPCPKNRVEYIKDALKHFGMVDH